LTALARTISQPGVPSPLSPVQLPYRYSTSFSADRATLAKHLSPSQRPRARTAI
jgi:hypothetical protein